MDMLERSIELNLPPAQLWDFIATPRNLNQLTPPDLDFTIVSDPPERMYEGMTIQYKIKIPLLGRWNWLTEIKHIRPGISFVDEQRKGPYSFWYHYHEIEPLGDGRSRMIDRVNYCLPLEPLSLPVREFVVKGMLRDIFDYREKRLKELFS